MMTGKSLLGRSELAAHTIDALRRDAAFIGNIVISVVFIAFATFAVASAVLDLIAIRH